MLPCRQASGRISRTAAGVERSAITTAAMGTARAVPLAAILGDTLLVEGTPGADQIRIMATKRIGFVGVISGTKLLGTYGPVAQIDVNARRRQRHCCGGSAHHPAHRA